MNDHPPSPPLNVPVLTEVIEPADGVTSPPLMPVSPDVLPVLDAVVDPMWAEPAAHIADMPPTGDLPSGEDVPRNLLRGVTDQPLPMQATVAAPSSQTSGSESALASARASLSQALRSAREGRWAPLPPAEWPQPSTQRPHPPTVPGELDAFEGAAAASAPSALSSESSVVAPAPSGAASASPEDGVAALLIEALSALPAAPPPADAPQGEQVAPMHAAAQPPQLTPLTPLTPLTQLHLPDLLEAAPDLGERLMPEVPAGSHSELSPGVLADRAQAADAAALLAASLGPVEVTDVTEPQLVHRVLSVVQKQIDGMIEFRLREAMGPVLQRHADALVRELRDELKQTMQDVVTRAVAQEMAKVRPR